MDSLIVLLTVLIMIQLFQSITLFVIGLHYIIKRLDKDLNNAKDN